MDKAKILRLCNEIEMLMGEIYNTGHMMQNCDYEAVDKRLKAIAAEISAPPKSNGDRIRQMTDKEIAQFIARPLCEKCAWYGKCKSDINLTCDGKGQLKWIKEVSEDAGTD